MDARLHKAAIRGDVTSLLDLLQREEHILDGVGVGVGVMVMHDPIANENPLHVAAQFGHVDFAKEILSRKPEYAHKSNSQGQSPLHLASGAGHLEVVKLLLEKDAGVCFLRDKRGRTPLHIAARKGRVEVLKELVLAEPTAAWVQTELGEPILHLCASNGQFEALEKLIELIPDDDFVNMKDDDDNSVLHLLAREIQTEVMNILLRNRRLYNRRLDINCLNMKKDTPLDVLLKAPRSSGSRTCKKVLRGAGGKRAKELSQAPATTHPKNTWWAHADWLNDTKSALIVVAILIATVAYQAGLNPPGGVWQDDYPPFLAPGDDKTKFDQWYADNKDYIAEKRHVAGESVMSSERPFKYLLFSIFNVIALLSSASIILLLVSGFNLKRRGLMWVLMITIWISIGSMAGSYAVSSYYLTNYYAPIHASIKNVSLYVISICAVLALTGPLVTAHLVRLVIRLWKKFKTRKGSEIEDGLVIRLWKKFKSRRACLENRDDEAVQVSVDPSTPAPWFPAMYNQNLVMTN